MERIGSIVPRREIVNPVIIVHEDPQDHHLITILNLQGVYADPAAVGLILGVIVERLRMHADKLESGELDVDMRPLATINDQEPA